MASRICWLGAVVAWVACVCPAAPNDWAEGAGESDGATRDYYNRAARLAWRSKPADWTDAAGKAQGGKAYATATLVDDDTPKAIAWDVTALVGEWLAGKHPNQGMLLRGVSGRGTFHFRSREHAEADQRPQLLVTTAAGRVTLPAQADTYTEPSTYRSMGKRDSLRLAAGSNCILVRFDLTPLGKRPRVTQAVLRLFTHAQYGAKVTAGVFRATPGEAVVVSEPTLGLSRRYPGDRGIAKDPAVVFATNFESADWKEQWTFAHGALDTVTADAPHGFAPLAGKAVRIKIAQGSNAAMNVGYKFRPATGAEPEEIYFRYYLRLGSDWNQTLQGGKMPGPSGTYGRAGWGGRRTNGTRGWSARGAFGMTIPAGNPLAGLTPMGTYCYHADQKGTYGDVWYWSKGYRGYLARGRWYCIEQYLKMNTPGMFDGVLRAWVDGRPAFEKTDIRFRKVPQLKIEQIWFNVYHGGKKPSPHDQHLYMDNVVIARKYIGPMPRLVPRL